jgi:hypothetical protein
MKNCHLIDMNINWCFCVVEVRLFTGSGLGSGHATTPARATLLLAIYELQYVLQLD